MKKEFIPYRQENHGTFDEEWLPHKDASGWWYITGYCNDIAHLENLYSYQFTVINPHLFGLSPYVLQLAVTDVQTGQHLFHQQMKLGGKDIYIGKGSVHFGAMAHLERKSDCMDLTVKTDLFSFTLTLNKGKGATWHGDNGVLVMGMPAKPKERTVYYSYTNMPTSGQVCFVAEDGTQKDMRINGKSWFDRQWGPYHLADNYTHWEWFSLRFFDDEEVMLFAFPQNPYYDGTFIGKNKERMLVRDYTYTPKQFVDVNGMSFSKGWDLTMPGIKEEKYEIKPLTEGQLNLAYFELIAEVINPKGKRVGYCIVELLPGARNPDKKIGMDLFKKV
jgi:predicted secreted hydrolase